MAATTRKPDPAPPADEQPPAPVAPDSPARAATITALLAERAGLARRGLTERVAQVDAELARHGHTAAPGEVDARGLTTR